MSTIDTTFLRASKEVIASPTDYPQSPLSQALRQPVLLGLFLPIHHGGWSSSNLPRTKVRVLGSLRMLTSAPARFMVAPS